MWVKAFNFQKGIIYIVFTATELHSDSDTLFFLLFSIPRNSGNNVKTKNYKKDSKNFNLVNHAH